MKFGQVYNVVEEKNLDKDTYLMVFDNKVDKDGDVYHLEVEYHIDEKAFAYVNVYEHQVMPSTIPLSVKRKIEGYVLRKLGIIKNTLTTHYYTIAVEIDVDDDATIGELESFLDEINVEVNFPQNKKFKVYKTSLNRE